jgi:hypothetical protein
VLHHLPERTVEEHMAETAREHAYKNQPESDEGPKVEPTNLSSSTFNFMIT